MALENPIARVVRRGLRDTAPHARMFQQHVGQSPHAYVQAVRVALAERAIAEGQPANQAVAAAGIARGRQWRRLRSHRNHIGRPS